MQRHRLRIALAALALAALAPGPEAQADRLSVARDQPLVEVSHAVDLQIVDGVARYRVRRSFANSGTVSEEASLRIELAHAAAVTGLRIRARERWFDGELMDADLAREKYRELTGLGAFEARDPALLQWVWADQVHLQVFPVLPGGVNTVEYTLTAPLEYRNGRYVVTYPHADPDRGGDTLTLVDPVLRVHPNVRGAEIRVAGRRVAADEPVIIVAPPPQPWIGDGGPSESASYIFSKLEVERDEPIDKASVHLEIDHTFSGDLRVALITPGGEHIPIADGKGGENDIRGVFPVELPEGARTLGTWHLMVADEAGLDVGSLDAWSLEFTPKTKKGADTKAPAPIVASARDLPRFIPDAPDAGGSTGHVVIEVGPPKIRQLAARLGRVVASASKGFSRLEIDAAPRMGELPRRAAVVFVLDTSRSQDDETLADQLRIVDGYLRHVPDARVELVATDRRAHRVLGDFVPVAELPAALARARAAGKLAFKNGSALETGLELAADLLAAQAVHAGPGRIVALTDARLRTRFRTALADHALADAPPAAITHVVIPQSDGYASLERDDSHDLSPIAEHARGVLFLASAPADDKRSPDVMLGLVRPTGIDHFNIAGITLKDSDAGEAPTVLREGDSYRAMFATQSPTRRVVLTGKVWAAPVRRVITTNEPFDIATAGFVFSEDEHGELSDDEMRTVAYRGRAVSPVTSYLAVEPGVRPSVDGLTGDEIGESIGLGGLGLVGHGAGGGGYGAPAPRLADLLADAVQRCQQTHPAPAGWRVDLSIETTSREIVDIEVTRSTHAPLRDCLVEAAWDLELPDAPWGERTTHTVALPQKSL